MKDVCEIKVSDIMSRSLVTIGIDEPFEEVIKNFVDAKVHALIVVGPGGEFMGVISHTDVINALHEHKEKVFELEAEDLMFPKPFTIDANANLKEAAAIMMKNKIHRLLVLSSYSGKLLPVGIISATDIIRAIASC